MSKQSIQCATHLRGDEAVSAKLQPECAVLTVGENWTMFVHSHTGVGHGPEAAAELLRRLACAASDLADAISLGERNGEFEVLYQQAVLRA